MASCEIDISADIDEVRLVLDDTSIGIEGWIIDFGEVRLTMSSEQFQQLQRVVSLSEVEEIEQ